MKRDHGCAAASAGDNFAVLPANDQLAPAIFKLIFMLILSAVTFDGLAPRSAICTGETFWCQQRQK
jgi:hypothetical protein